MSLTYGDFLEGYIWWQPTNEDLAAGLPWGWWSSGPTAFTALPRWRWPLSLCPENGLLRGSICAYPTVIPSLRHRRHKQKWLIEVGLFPIRKVESQVMIMNILYGRVTQA